MVAFLATSISPATAVAAEEKPLSSLMCDVFGWGCSVVAQEGNGDGKEPPKSTKSSGG